MIKECIHWLSKVGTKSTQFTQLTQYTQKYTKLHKFTQNHTTVKINIKITHNDLDWLK